jgi:ketosteroid isomerase-like protein
MYEDVDAGRGDAVVARFAPDIELQFGGRPVVTGPDAARDTLRSVHEPFHSVSHEFRSVWEHGDTTICEFRATYDLKRGGVITLPSLTVLQRRDGAIASMRVYLDEGPLRD